MTTLLSFSCNKNEERCSCGLRYSAFEPDLNASTAPFSGAWTELIADADPVVGGTATLTFRYEFQLSEEACDSLTLIAHGYFERSDPDIFTYVSGESSWVDTVKCHERIEHSVVIRAFREGELLIQAFVGAQVDPGWAAGGSDVVCLCVD